MILIRSHPGKGLKVGEGLRLTAAMLGMDHIPSLVFLDEGVECLRPGVYDAKGKEYLKTAADLAGITALSESLRQQGLWLEDLDQDLRVTAIDMNELASMMQENEVVAAF